MARPDLRAVIVCVDFSDILSITLPSNSKHFSEILVVTTPEDTSTQAIVSAIGNAKCFLTRSFFDRGAEFNKWVALEESLDVFGRHGWITLLDSDILWPRVLPESFIPQPGFLYSPLRRMFTDLVLVAKGTIPEEAEWSKLPVHKNVGEWAGYSQTFWAMDHVLGPPPWHEVCYRHAGISDSIFQDKWPKHKKVRPDFHVLHLGIAGENWFGRCSNYLDGTMPPDAEAKRQAVRRIWAGRASRRGKGGERYEGEKLGSP